MVHGLVHVPRGLNRKCASSKFDDVHNDDHDDHDDKQRKALLRGYKVLIAKFDSKGDFISVHGSRQSPFTQASTDVEAHSSSETIYEQRFHQISSYWQSHVSTELYF